MIETVYNGATMAVTSLKFTEPYLSRYFTGTYCVEVTNNNDVIPAGQKSQNFIFHINITGEWMWPA